MHGLARFVTTSALLVPLAAAQDAPPEHVQAFVQEHCVSCHGEDMVKGRLDLTIAPEGDVERLWRWSRMRERVRSYEMPPLHDSDVTPAERERFVGWVEAQLDADVPQLAADPGSVTVRRLSRTQWQRVVHDLFGVEVDTAAFPADDLGYGFDTIGDALTFSTLHLESYLLASRRVAEKVFHGEDPEHPELRQFAAGSMRLVEDRGASMRGDVAHMYSRATIEQRVVLPRAGRYRVRVSAAGQQAGPEPCRMLVQLDGERFELFTVPNEGIEDFAREGELAGGAHTFAVSFVNDYYDPKNEDPKQRDRNLAVHALEVEGPLDAPVVPAQQRWLHDEAAARKPARAVRALCKRLLPLVWRDQVDGAATRRIERAALARLDAGESLVQVQRFVLAAALTSPNFLFRIEARPRKGVEQVRGAELAARLSFFLWASAPDDELREAARRGGLTDDGGDDQQLVAQVDRMLADPRSDSLAGDFAAQWWGLRLLAERMPDPEQFPQWSDALRTSMQRESELLFDAVLRERRDVRELLDCDFTHLDARLAAFYGLPRDAGDAPDDAFVRVPLAGDARLRGGLLGHASVHAVTCNPTRTSPVKRGKWILENLLGQPPPPPPPGNDSFGDEAAIDSSASLREQMAQHRADSKCAVCHVRMDALGLTLERFDVIGRRRLRDAAGEIDASGELPDGTALAGLPDLKRAVAADPAFVRTVAHKLFVYAVGRDLRPVDRLRVDHAVRALLRTGEVTLRDLVLVVVRDPAFRQKAGA